MKKVRSILALALALTMVFALAACGNGGGGGGSDTEWEVGFNVWGTAGAPTFDLMAEIIDSTLSTFGAKGIRANDDHMADRELENIQNFISSGVDGLVMQAAAPPVLTPAAKAAMDSEIPFVLGINTGTDEDREALVGSNPFYVGSVSADMVQDGYIAGKAAIEAGHKTAVIIGGNIGNKHQDDRVAGFTQAFETEGGGKVLDAARCTSPAECQEKANALLSANRDADCIYAMVGDYVPGTVVSADLLELSDIPIYASNINSDSIEHIRSGRVVMGGSGNDLAGGIAAILLMNYLDGHPITDADGNPPELVIHPFLVTADNVDDYLYLFGTEGVAPLHEEIVKKLSWRYNSDVSYDTFIDVLDNGMTLEALLAPYGR